MFQGQRSIYWLVPGALNQPLLEIQGMHTFEIESQAYQAPLTSRSPEAAQGELAEPQDFLDDPDQRFDGAFPQAIDGSSNLHQQLVGHLFFWSGLFTRRFGQFGEKGAPIFMMRFASSGDI